jgi:hypothetical protein
VDHSVPSHYSIGTVEERKEIYIHLVYALYAPLATPCTARWQRSVRPISDAPYAPLGDALLALLADNRNAVYSQQFARTTLVKEGYLYRLLLR